MKKKTSSARALAMCRENGLQRSLEGILRQWRNISKKYRSIRDWEIASGVSYFDTSLCQRKENSLPLTFNRRFYDQFANKIVRLPRNEEGCSRWREEDMGGQPVPLAVIEPYEFYHEKPLLLLPRLEKEDAVKEKEKEAEQVEDCSLPQLVYAGSEEAMDENVVAFADGCLRFEDDNVADGFLKAQVEQAIEQAQSGEFAKKGERPRPTLQACRSRRESLKQPKHEDELELVEERTKETLEASRSYQWHSERWRNQRIHLDKQRLELLMKADAAFLAAINQLALAVQRLAEKLC
ncbi:hypothetical protein SELMODRAFT_415349 [Selaginella moellendorffii]|uniref:Uncharacterized protein n=1 Tax=Selaginella moellendorffii TaxID=88036 RepID=D8RVU5_SELML|nr:hypothetical protein SELMODRAFT_415349 [Selaginella moellendorffii]